MLRSGCERLVTAGGNFINLCIARKMMQRHSWHRHSRESDGRSGGSLSQVSHLLSARGKKDRYLPMRIRDFVTGFVWMRLDSVETGAPQHASESRSIGRRKIRIRSTQPEKFPNIQIKNSSLHEHPPIPAGTHRAAGCGWIQAASSVKRFRSF